MKHTSRLLCLGLRMHVQLFAGLGEAQCEGNDMMWYGMVWYGTVRYGTVWYGTVRYGTVRYGTVR